MSLRQALYARLMPGFRRRRTEDFRRRLAVTAADRILDVGGYPANWDGTGLGSRVACLNVDFTDDAAGHDHAPLRVGVAGGACPSKDHGDGGRRSVGADALDTLAPGHDHAPLRAGVAGGACPSMSTVMEGAAPSAPAGQGMRLQAQRGVPRQIRGDGRRLPFADGAFDVAYSNSVIEHVGDGEDQRRFAAEVRRVAARLWVQTPSRWFPVEPHLVAPFVHFLPRRLQHVLARWATPWGWENRPSAEQARAFVDGIRLLTFREMRELFPDCEILRERFLGLTKSFVALRKG
jgi:hypothetical protein